MRLDRIAVAGEVRGHPAEPGLEPLPEPHRRSHPRARERRRAHRRAAGTGVPSHRPGVETNRRGRLPRPDRRLRARLHRTGSAADALRRGPARVRTLVASGARTDRQGRAGARHEGRVPDRSPAPRAEAGRRRARRGMRPRQLHSHIRPHGGRRGHRGRHRRLHHDARARRARHPAHPSTQASTYVRGNAVEAAVPRPELRRRQLFRGAASVR